MLSIGYIACPPKSKSLPGEDENPYESAVRAREAIATDTVIKEDEGLQLALLNDAQTTSTGAEAACAEPSQSLSTTTHTHHTNSLSKLPLELLQAILLSMGLISETQQMSKTKTQQAPDTEGEAPVVNTSREEPLFTLAKLAELSLVSKEWNRAIQQILRACRAYICDDKLQAANRPSAIAHFLWNNHNTFFISHVLRWLSTSTAVTEDILMGAIEYESKIQKIIALELVSKEALPVFMKTCLPDIPVRYRLERAIKLIDKDKKAAIAVYYVIATATTEHTRYRLQAAEKLVEFSSNRSSKNCI